MEEYRDSPEALGWLRANPNQDSGFASNRFTMEDAIKFVEALYAGGATKVVIPQDSIREDDEVTPGVKTPYADSMAVFYEPNIVTNESMIRMCLKEIEDEGFLVKHDEDGEQIEMSIDEALPTFLAGDGCSMWWD